MESPFSSDFGDGQTGLHFQDGACEQDVSLTELLDDIFNNHDECSGEELNSQKYSAIGVDTRVNGQVPPLQVKLQFMILTSLIACTDQKKKTSLIACNDAQLPII